MDRPAARVVWIFAREDEPLARELLRFSAVLANQGLIDNWSVGDIAPGQERKRELDERLRSADVIMLLVSPDLLANPEPGWTRALELPRRRERTRVVPVILRPTLLPPELAALQSLPRDGQAVVARRDRDGAILEVIQGLQEIVTFSRQPKMVPAPPQPRVVGVLTINDIFRLNGPPSITFVEPPQFAVLKLELRTMGTGLIVEGPSKIGKSTAIKKALEALGVPAAQQIWWFGQRPPPLPEFRLLLDQLLVAQHDTWLFIDDFHYLEDPAYLQALAFRMKALADQDERRAKVTVIGINPLGSSLAQAMPDLAGRFRVLRIDRERDWIRSTKIAELIIQGERAANVRFTRRDEFIVAAGGSFFIAQLLCNRAAVQAGVLEPARFTVDIDLGPADVVAAIRDELAARYRAPMLDFAAFDVAPPPRGGGLSLLWLLARSGDGFVALKEARLRFPALGPVLDWFLESNLSRCFQQHLHLKGLLYFNRATTTLTMEDPQLKFYLRELNWEEFAEASGHGHVRFHPEDGPIWSMAPAAPIAPGHLEATTPTDDRAPPQEPRRALLQLSDLHLATADEATLAYAQLAADLRQLGVDRLDGLVVSGDLVNRALPAEYEAARMFLEQLAAGFGLPPRRIVVVPGNHDVSWPLSEAAYTLHKRSRYGGPLVPGSFIEHGPDIVEVRDEAAYRRRFQPFAEFHRQLKGHEYPLDYGEQGLVEDFPELGLTILGLNSAWEIDHHYGDRASIHLGALSRALVQLGPPTADRLRVAVFHHPIHSDEESRLRDPAFLDQLALAGFRVVLHGHVHKADSTLFRYDHSLGGRQIEEIAAGTFGAPVRSWVPGYPLHYNVLFLAARRLTVESRCRRQVNGAWEADARWRQGPGRDPLPRYSIDL